MWSRRAETYVDMLQYQGSGMVEGYIESASDREWAVRDQLTAKAAAFASDEVRDLWQQSALANLALQSYVDEEWPELTVGAGVLAIEDASEKDPELRRLHQASAQASKQLAVQIRAELDVSSRRTPGSSAARGTVKTACRHLSRATRRASYYPPCRNQWQNHFRKSLRANFDHSPQTRLLPIKRPAQLRAAHRAEMHVTGQPRIFHRLQRERSVDAHWLGMPAVGVHRE